MIEAEHVQQSRSEQPQTPEYPWAKEYFAELVDQSQVEAIVAGMQGVDRATGLMLINDCLSLTMMNVIAIQQPGTFSQLGEGQANQFSLRDIDQVMPGFSNQAREALAATLRETQMVVATDVEANV